MFLALILLNPCFNPFLASFSTCTLVIAICLKPVNLSMVSTGSVENVFYKFLDSTLGGTGTRTAQRILDALESVSSPLKVLDRMHNELRLLSPSSLNSFLLYFTC